MRSKILFVILIVSVQLSTAGSIQINTEKSTFLYGTKASSVEGDFDSHKGRFMPWKGNASLAWEVLAPTDEQYELYLTANVRKQGKDQNLYLNAGGKEYSITLSPTSGPYPGERNFERIQLPFKLSLKEGTQNISLATRGLSGDDIMLDFRSVELVPVSAKAKIIAEYKRAVDSRASVDWMIEAGYGLMFHWTSQSVQPDGSIKPYEEGVNAFDVERFAGMVEATGAGYVFLTIGHAESYCPAPIKSWEKCHPGMTTQRDLIVEIADALAKINIPFLCYINGPLGFNLNVKGSSSPSKKEKLEFVENFNAILAEIGERYKDKLSGYWFDSWYQIFEEFPDVPFEEFHAATKIGNDDRIICLNSWIYPPVTSWQEYWAGEVGKQTIAIPQNGYMVDGPVPDLRYHALMILEKGGWVQKTAKEIDPHFDAEELSRYIQDCRKNGGAVTINIAIYQDGTIGSKSLDVMKEVKDRVRRSLPQKVR